jgi:hypothetical protein
MLDRAVRTPVADCRQGTLLEGVCNRPTIEHDRRKCWDPIDPARGDRTALLPNGLANGREVRMTCEAHLNP